MCVVFKSMELANHHGDKKHTKNNIYKLVIEPCVRKFRPKQFYLIDPSTDGGFSSTTQSTGCYPAVSVAAIHGHKKVMRSVYSCSTAGLLDGIFSNQKFQYG
jgi:hypothetical protein